MSVCICLCLFASLFIGQYYQMISCQKIYGLYVLEHHSVKINGDVTMRDKQQPSEDRDTQLMDTECWVSQFIVFSVEEKSFGYQFNFYLSTGEESIPAMGEINPKSGAWFRFFLEDSSTEIVFLASLSWSHRKGISCLGADSTSCDSILGYCPNFGHISNKFERNGAVTTFTAFMATGWRHFYAEWKMSPISTFQVSHHWDSNAILKQEVGNLSERNW